MAKALHHGWRRACACQDLFFREQSATRKQPTAVHQQQPTRQQEGHEMRLGECLPACVAVRVCVMRGWREASDDNEASRTHQPHLRKRNCPRKFRNAEQAKCEKLPQPHCHQGPNTMHTTTTTCPDTQTGSGRPTGRAWGAGFAFPPHNFRRGPSVF